MGSEPLVCLLGSNLEEVLWHSERVACSRWRKWTHPFPFQEWFAACISERSGHSSALMCGGSLIKSPGFPEAEQLATLITAHTAHTSQHLQSRRHPKPLVTRENLQLCLCSSSRSVFGRHVCNPGFVHHASGTAHMFYYLAESGPTETQLPLVPTGHVSRVWPI